MRSNERSVEDGDNDLNLWSSGLCDDEGEKGKWKGIHTGQLATRMIWFSRLCSSCACDKSMCIGNNCCCWMADSGAHIDAFALCLDSHVDIIYRNTTAISYVRQTYGIRKRAFSCA